MKKICLMCSLIFTSLLLFGCSNIGGSDSNILFQLFVIPVEDFIHLIAESFQGSYGWAIIIVTCIIRLALMPIMLQNIKKQKMMQKRMVQIKPELDSLQEKIKETNDGEKKLEYQQQLLRLYKDHNISIANVGCLPFILQTPLLMGLYYAIQFDKTIAVQKFLWFNLGTPDIILTLIACLLYYFQFYVSTKNMEEKQRKQMRFMGLLSPIMIGIISLSSASALSLYWSTSALLLIVQQLISIKLYPNLVVNKAES